MVFFGHFMGLKLKNSEKWSGDISKLYLHTEFQENRSIRLVSSDAHRQTDTHTHRHTDTHTHIRTDIFSKPLFWTQGTSKRIIPQKSQHRIFLPSQYFLHTYCIWEKVKIRIFKRDSFTRTG